MRAALAAWVLCCVSVGASACADPPPPTDPPVAGAADPHAAAGPCEACHAPEAASWATSHHALATGEGAPAPERFDGRPVHAGTLTVTPLLAEGAPAFRVQDGAGTRVWPVVGTLGVAPLQQYLVKGDRGRRLVAPVAWDVAAARWFDPAPGGGVGDPDDPLYWAGLAGTWNHLCGECHATGFVKGYDAATDTYRSTSTHPAVACVACHGEHAEAAVTTQDGQIRACAPCHSRRATVDVGGRPTDDLLDHYRPALIGAPVFLADGRNNAPEEPFEWGAFVQSRMYAAGVRCTDCHDPHTGGLRAEGDAVCERCHPAMAASPAHPDPTGCVSCHMPTRNYMGIHARHDHGLRRPSATGRSELFSAALQGNPASVPELLALGADPAASAFDRASALSLLRRLPPPPDPTVLRPLLRVEDPLVRVEAVATAGAWGDVVALAPALSDPVRSVRFSAFEAFVSAGAPVALRPTTLPALQAEYEAAALARGDLASAWQNLAIVRLVLGSREGAISAFEASLARDPHNEAARRALEGLGAHTK